MIVPSTRMAASGDVRGTDTDPVSVKAFGPCGVMRARFETTSGPWPAITWKETTTDSRDRSFGMAKFTVARPAASSTLWKPGIVR